MFFAMYDRFLKSIGETYILESWSRIQRAVDFDEMKIVGEQIPYSANPFFVVVNDKQGKMMFSGLASTPIIDEKTKKTSMALKDYTTLFNTEILVDWSKFKGKTVAEYLNFILSIWLEQTDVGFGGIDWDVSSLSGVLLDTEIPLGESVENVSLYALVCDVFNYYNVYCTPILDLFKKTLTFNFLKSSLTTVSVRLKDFGVTAIEKSFGEYNRATVYDYSHQKVEQWAITPENKIVKILGEGVKTVLYIGEEKTVPSEPDPDEPKPDEPNEPEIPDEFDMIIDNIYVEGDIEPVFGIFGAYEPIIEFDDYGNTVFFYDTLGLRISATGITDPSELTSPLQLKKGQSLTFYPYSFDGATDTISKDWKFKIYIPENTKGILTYNGTYIIWGENSLHWSFAPITIEFSYNDQTGVGTINVRDKDGDGATKYDADFSLGVTIEVK